MKTLRAVFMMLSMLLCAPVLAYDGAMVSSWYSAPVLVPNSWYEATYVKMIFPQVNLDTGGFWNAAKNSYVIPETIPSGTYGEFMCHARWQDTGGNRVQSLISKYDASAGVQLQSNYPESAPDNRTFVGGTTTDHISFTHPVLLEAGDEYACQMWQTGPSGSSAAIDVVQAGMSLQILQ